MSERYEVPETRPAVSYGPVPDSDQWVLSVSTIVGERVEIVVGEQAMYDLWIEVRGVPWPTGDRKGDRLVRQVVHAANGADNEMLEDALAALGVGRRPGRPSTTREDVIRKHKLEQLEELEDRAEKLTQLRARLPEIVTEVLVEDRKRIARELYERSELPQVEIAEILDESPAWVSQAINEDGGSA